MSTVLHSEDLRIDTYSAGRRYSVRVVHLPTGMTGTSDQHRSLIEAREEALTRLRDRIEKS